MSESANCFNIFDFSETSMSNKARRFNNFDMFDFSGTMPLGEHPSSNVGNRQPFQHFQLFGNIDVEKSPPFQQFRHFRLLRNHVSRGGCLWLQNGSPNVENVEIVETFTTFRHCGFRKVENVETLSILWKSVELTEATPLGPKMVSPMSKMSKLSKRSPLFDIMVPAKSKM